MCGVRAVLLPGRQRCLTLPSSSVLRLAPTPCSSISSCSALFCFCSISICRSACKWRCTSNMPTPSRFGRALGGPYRRVWRRPSANTRITSVAAPPISHHPSAVIPLSIRRRSRARSGSSTALPPQGHVRSSVLRPWLPSQSRKSLWLTPRIWTPPCAAGSSGGPPTALPELPPRGGQKERMAGSRPDRIPVYGAGLRKKPRVWLRFHAPQVPGNSHCAPTAATRSSTDEDVLLSPVSLQAVARSIDRHAVCGSGQPCARSWASTVAGSSRTRFPAVAALKGQARAVPSVSTKRYLSPAP